MLYRTVFLIPILIASIWVLITFREACICTTFTHSLNSFFELILCELYRFSSLVFFLLGNGLWLVCLLLVCDLNVYLNFFFFGFPSFLTFSSNATRPCSYFLTLFFLVFFPLIFWGILVLTALFSKLTSSKFCVFLDRVLYSLLSFLLIDTPEHIFLSSGKMSGRSNVS